VIVFLIGLGPVLPTRLVIPIPSSIEPWSKAFNEHLIIKSIFRVSSEKFLSIPCDFIANGMGIRVNEFDSDCRSRWLHAGWTIVMQGVGVPQ